MVRIGKSRVLGRLARGLAREWRQSLPALMHDGPEVITGRPLTRHGPLATDGDVLRALARLRESSGWERLDIYRDPVTGVITGGYCSDASGRNIDTAQALRGVECPEVILFLSDIIDDCGWQRLEAIANHRIGGTGGYCERADGSGVSWPDLYDREVMKLSSVDHPGAAIHVAGPVQEAPGAGE